jgi:D-alanine transaminase
LCFNSSAASGVCAKNFWPREDPVPRLAPRRLSGNEGVDLISYLNGSYLPREEIRISPDDRGFLFGDGVYEVIRAYHGKFFRAETHLTRLRRSLHELEMADIDTEELYLVAMELLRRNDLTEGDATVYIQITRGVAPRKHFFPAPSTPLTVYLTVSPFNAPVKKAETGVKVILLPDIRWARCDIKSIALTPNVLANQRAVESSAEEAVLVRNGAITEGSHSNFAAVFNSEFVTHPKTNHILPGVTREVVLDLCRELGIPVKEFPIFEEDLHQADEAMLLSTSNEVMPVVQIDDQQVGDGKPGPITLKLQRAFQTLAQR